MVRACFYAWHHIAIRSHWLTAYASSHMLERRNNGQIVKGGGMSFRMGKKFEDELGINLKKMISLDLHAVADTEHSDSISAMFERYVKTPEDRELVLEGARDCMAIDRAYRGALGYYMEQIK
jgi:pyrroloquinoline quinone (PQQ) biosynthesis protein C